MRTKQPYTMWVPKPALNRLNYCLKENSPLFDYERENFYFLLNIFYRIPTYNKDYNVKENGYLEISKKYFEAYITDNYAKYVDYLVENKIILKDGKYSKEKHISLGYLLPNKLIADLVPVPIPPKSRMWKRLKANSNVESKKKMEPHIKAMKQHLRKVYFDEAGAISFMRHQLANGKISQHRFNINFNAVKRVNQDDFTFGRNKTNYRLDHNLTNIKKELRNFIKLKNCSENLIQIDVKCCHPVLLNHLIQQKEQISYPSSCAEYLEVKPLKALSSLEFQQLDKSPNIPTEEASLYRKETLNGKIYELLMEEFNISRDEAKRVFMGISYSKNRSILFKEKKRLFRKLFPHIYEMISTFKKHDHSAFAILIQIFESEIFIDNIARKLFKADIIPITVHDCIIVKESEKKFAIEIVNSEFNRLLGFVPSLKVYTLSPLSNEIVDELEVNNVLLIEKYDPHKPKPQKDKWIVDFFNKIKKTKSKRKRERIAPIPDSLKSIALIQRNNRTVLV